ncbi:MAG: hypothetical protein PHE43_04700 [Candidatus Nanoarchaeia archaeon]|nr:hypothetical protein [Candidatus Nanoarchaeia archaeon]
MATNDVRIKCSQCGRFAMASEFVLDHIFKRMVCPSCIKDRRDREKVHEEFDKRKEVPEVKKEEPKKPIWDELGISKTVATNTEEVKPRSHSYQDPTRFKQINASIANGDKVRYKCPKCNFEFNYNPTTKVPSDCPYCRLKIN